MGLGPQAWSGGLCHLHSADSDPALRTRWGRMQLLGQCRLTAGAGPCKLCLLRSPLSSAREPHTRLFLPNRLGSVMTVLLEDPPTQAPVTTSCSPRHGHSQLCGQQSTLNQGTQQNKTRWQKRHHGSREKGPHIP